MGARYSGSLCARGDSLDVECGLVDLDGYHDFDTAGSSNLENALVYVGENWRHVDLCAGLDVSVHLSLVGDLITYLWPRAVRRPSTMLTSLI